MDSSSKILITNDLNSRTLEILRKDATDDYIAPFFGIRREFLMLVNCTTNTVLYPKDNRQFLFENEISYHFLATGMISEDIRENSSSLPPLPFTDLSDAESVSDMSDFEDVGQHPEFHMERSQFEIPSECPSLRITEDEEQLI